MNIVVNNLVFYVGVAQLDRAFGYGPKGRGFESSSARFLRLCTVFVRLRTLVMRSGNVDKFGVSAFFMHKNEITLFTVSFCFKPEASRGERAMQELGLQA